MLFLLCIIVTIGKVAGAIRDIKPAREIVDEMMKGALEAFSTAGAFCVLAGSGGRSRM
jgi:hypothetical protein